MLTIQGRDTSTVWWKLLSVLVDSPEHRVSPRDCETQEILGVSLKIDDLRNNLLVHPERNLNYRFAVAEWWWIFLGLEDVATVARYNGQMNRFSDDGKILAGAYGPRLSSQWRYVRQVLRHDRNTRQAVATIWTPNPARSRDIPCTISLQFIIREENLNVIVTMRSSDVWLGLPYDMFVFSQLGNMLAGELNCKRGWLMMQLGSSHLYASNIEQAAKVTKFLYSGETVRAPELPGWPKNPKRYVRALRGAPHVRIPSPWSMYYNALRLGKSADALAVLRNGYHE